MKTVRPTAVDHHRKVGISLFSLSQGSFLKYKHVRLLSSRVRFLTLNTSALPLLLVVAPGGRGRGAPGGVIGGRVPEVHPGQPRGPQHEAVGAGYLGARGGLKLLLEMVMVVVLLVVVGVPVPWRPVGAVVRAAVAGLVGEHVVGEAVVLPEHGVSAVRRISPRDRSDGDELRLSRGGAQLVVVVMVRVGRRLVAAAAASAKEVRRHVVGLRTVALGLRQGPLVHSFSPPLEGLSAVIGVVFRPVLAVVALVVGVGVVASSAPLARVFPPVFLLEPWLDVPGRGGGVLPDVARGQVGDVAQLLLVVVVVRLGGRGGGGGAGRGGAVRVRTPAAPVVLVVVAVPPSLRLCAAAVDGVCVLAEVLDCHDAWRVGVVAEAHVDGVAHLVVVGLLHVVHEVGRGRRVEAPDAAVLLGEVAADGGGGGEAGGAGGLGGAVGA